MVECTEKSGYIEDKRNAFDEMNNKNAIKIIENEITCVQRANYCDRDCTKCDLVMVDNAIISAYKKAISALKNVAKYRKEYKRFKRKYIFLSLAIKQAMNEIIDMADADAYSDYQLGIGCGLMLAYQKIKDNINIKDMR